MGLKSLQQVKGSNQKPAGVFDYSLMEMKFFKRLQKD